MSAVSLIAAAPSASSPPKARESGAVDGAFDAVLALVGELAVGSATSAEAAAEQTGSTVPPDDADPSLPDANALTTSPFAAASPAVALTGQAAPAPDAPTAEVPAPTAPGAADAEPAAPTVGVAPSLVLSTPHSPAREGTAGSAPTASPTIVGVPAATRPRADDGEVPAASAPRVPAQARESLDAPQTATPTLSPSGREPQIIASPPTMTATTPERGGPRTTHDDASPIPIVAAAAPLAAPPQVEGPLAAAAPTPARAIAAQVSPAVVSIAQRPTGSHQITMTVNPESLGPVTVRAHIGQRGDVRVELVGATDAGLEALRAMVTDLRRDLVTVMPHATLSLAPAGAAESAPAGHGPQSGAGHHAREQAPHDPAGSAGRPAAPSAQNADPGRAHGIRHPHTAGHGAGLDILV